MECGIGNKESNRHKIEHRTYWLARYNRDKCKKLYTKSKYEQLCNNKRYTEVFVSLINWPWIYATTTTDS